MKEGWRLKEWSQKQDYGLSCFYSVLAGNEGEGSQTDQNMKLEGNQDLDQEVTGCGQHLDSEKFSGSWQGPEPEESCSWSEGSAQGRAGHLLCAKPLSLGKIWN